MPSVSLVNKTRVANPLFTLARRTVFLLLFLSALSGTASAQHHSGNALPRRSALSAPANLRVFGFWWAGAGPSDLLVWDTVPGATGYIVRRYDQPLTQRIRANYLVLPANQFAGGLTYTVAAVDAQNYESRDSNIANPQGAPDPARQPSWMPGAPEKIQTVTATGQWNAGQPRIQVSWRASNNSSTYNVYRNGSLLTGGVWGTQFQDTSVKAGVRYIYQVRGVNLPWKSGVEGPVGASSVSVAPPASTPSFRNTPISITKVTPNDDSVEIAFSLVPGAADYRVYKKSAPWLVKYSGGGLSVEMNDIDPVKGDVLVVEALDKLGPFEKMDGAMALPGTPDVLIAINGQGDPSNVPNVIARSENMNVVCVPRSFSGAQTFLDRFQDEAPFEVLPAVTDSRILKFVPANQIGEQQNNRWIVRNYFGDQSNTRIFAMGSHLMDTFYDGGTPFVTSPLHNNYSSLVFTPKATADINGGKVLHVTFEVDAHFSSRRWCEVMVTRADDVLIRPGITSGNQWVSQRNDLFRWNIMPEFHNVEMRLGKGGTKPDESPQSILNLIDTSWGPNSERFTGISRIGYGTEPSFNGTTMDLDKRHHFDLYLSATRFRILEQGKVLKDGSFPSGASLPFGRVAVHFVHQFYHSSNDRMEQVAYNPAGSYFINHRPWADERHWDNMGFEVLNAFPAR